MKISKTDRGQKALQSLERRLRVSNRSEQTIRNYVRCVKALMEYHQQLPNELEIDHIIDFLNELQVEQERAWRTIKIYVAAFRWFYEHILQAKEFASLIPYPREKHYHKYSAGKNWPASLTTVPTRSTAPCSGYFTPQD